LATKYRMVDHIRISLSETHTVFRASCY
jgi:hypothetical protein